MIKKALQPTNDAYIQFTEEELQEIGVSAGTKFSVKHHDDGSIELRPYKKIEIDIEDWPREILEMLITHSCEQDISVNDIIGNLLRESLDKYPTDEYLEQAKKDLVLEMGYLYKANIDPDSTNTDTSVTSER
jgi:hypothetical protein